jgi:hypothetical protein
MWTLRRALDILPPGLDETYSRILGTVNELEKPAVRLILQWLCFSFRPLRIEELAQIVHIGDAIGPPFNPDAVVFNPEDILDICPGLLTLTMFERDWIQDNVWKFFKEGTELQIVQLAHFSVKEYLLQSPHAVCWALDQELSHLAILKSSMAYFIYAASELSDDTQSLAQTWHDLAILHSLAIYCAMYTENHLSALAPRQREHPDLLESFRRLLDPDSGFMGQRLALPYFQSPLFSANKAVGRKRVPAAGMSLLFAARFGLVKMVEWLLSFDRNNRNNNDNLKCDINFVCYSSGWHISGPALAEASARGHISIVKLLLSDQYCARLDVDRQAGKHRMNALHLATRYNNEEIVRLLIDAGADVNVQHSSAGGALHIAARENNVNLIRMLLAHGADVDVTIGIKGATPLQVATEFGNEEVIRLLVGAGANVNYGSPRSSDGVGNKSPLQPMV